MKPHEPGKHASTRSVCPLFFGDCCGSLGSVGLPLTSSSTIPISQAVVKRLTDVGEIAHSNSSENRNTPPVIRQSVTVPTRDKLVCLLPETDWGSEVFVGRLHQSLADEVLGRALAGA